MPQSEEEQFVFPWMGIVANSCPLGGTCLRDILQKKGFNPCRVKALWDSNGHSGFAIVEFGKDWNGFSNAMDFERFYDAENRGREDYYEATNKDNELYGWMAREGDYNSPGLVGKNLRKSGDLKTISGVEDEDRRKTYKLLMNLSNTIEAKNTKLKETEDKFHEISMALINMISEKDQMYKAYNEEIEKMQRTARGFLENILKEHEAEIRKLEEYEKELEKRQALSDDAVRKLSAEKEMIERVRLEQKKADEKVLKLAEDQKREKEKLHRKILELEKQLDKKQGLELEIVRLKGAVPVMNHMGDDGDEEVKTRLVAIEKDLQEKEEELAALGELNHALLVKDLKNCNELQEARKELTRGMRYKELQQAREELIDGMKNSEWQHGFVRIKNMGEINTELIYSGTKRKLPEAQGAYNGKTCVIPELWNYKENRIATLGEGVAILIEEWKKYC